MSMNNTTSSGGSCNHCIHGATINEECLDCEILTIEIESWGELPVGAINDIYDFPRYVCEEVR